MINCTEVDVALEDARTLLFESDGGFYVACAALVLVSGLLLALGEVLVRPLGAVVSFSAASGGVFVLSSLFEGLPCEGRLVASGVAGVVAAMLVLCLLKAGLFAVGAGSFGALAHYVYVSIPAIEELDPPFTLAGRSGWYYISIGAAGLVGGVVAHAQRTHFVRLTTSLLGASGLAMAVHVIVEREEGKALPGVALLAVVGVGTLGGVLVQRHLYLKRKKKKECKLPK